MNKIIVLFVFSIFFLNNADAQFKKLDLKNKNFSRYTKEVEKGALSQGSNYVNKASKNYITIGTLHENQFSGDLTAEFVGDRAINISGVMKGVNTRDMNMAAYSYLLEAKKIMRIEDPREEFIISKEIMDEFGNRHIKMQQMYRGIPVYGKEVILHEKHGQIVSLNGVYSNTPNIDVIPSINIASNKEIIRADLKSPIIPIDKKLPGHENMKQWEHELVVLPTDDAKFKLVYHNTVYINILDRMEYFVDAKTGEIIKKYASLCKLHNHETFSESEKVTLNVKADIQLETKSNPLDGPETANATDLYGNSVLINTYKVGSNYFMVDASRPMYDNNSNMPDEPSGAIWTIDAFDSSPQRDDFSYDHVKSNNNGWSGDRSAVSAHFNGGKAYLYFKNVHNRNSINGMKGNIVSLVNITDENDNSMGNAFWNGQAMFYGNGDSSFKPLARALDVAGHELTHGVIQNTANLEYQGESGAINESMADVFGAMIDRDDWKIGEDVVKANVFTSGALRDLQDPHNGQSTNDYGHGYQPSHVSEKYTGSQDNGGVHLNSGITNHAFYLFANDQKLGSSANERKVKAEKVYYRALAMYLTKSSQFVDLRNAVIQAAGDLYTTAVVDAAKNAFQAVGIGAGAGTDHETDYESNPGDEYLIVADQAKTALHLYDENRNELLVDGHSFSTTAPYSKPSISDAGNEIVFVGEDRKIHYIAIDWNTAQISENIIFNDEIDYRNVVISKDGTKVAALTDDDSNTMEIYDDASGVWKTFQLYNPTYTNGVSTGDVNYADAMEFDPTGEWVMYDAESELTGESTIISYWDIGFIRVWDNANNLWGDGKIEKLFSSLPDDVSVGNPTFSKNSGYVIAFDYILEEENKIIGANLERNETGTIATDLFGLGYPSYSSDDTRLVYDFDFISTVDLGIWDLKSNKIESVAGSDAIHLVNASWGVFFSNGARDLSHVKSLASSDQLSFEVVPNPVVSKVNVVINSKWIGDAKLKVYDMNGKLLKTSSVDIRNGKQMIQVDVASINNGTYLLQLEMKEGNTSQQFVKVK